MDTTITLSESNYKAIKRVAEDLNKTKDELVNYIIQQFAYELNEETRELNDIPELHELVKLNPVNLTNAIEFAAALNMKLSDFINDILSIPPTVDIDRIYTRKHNSCNNQHSCNCKTKNSESAREF